PVVRIHRVIVSDSSIRRKSALKTQLSRGGLNVRCRRGERGLKGQLLSDALIGARIVVDAVSTTHHGFRKRFPREANARGEVVAIGAQQARGQASAVRPSLSRLKGRHGRRALCRIQDSRRKVEVGNAIVQFREWRNVLVAHSEIQRQVAPHFPLILGVQIPEVAAEVIVLSKLHRGLLREPQQKVGEVISGTAHRLEAHDLGGVQSRKNERPAQIAIRFRIYLHPPEVSTPTPGMLAVIPDYIVGKGISLVSCKLRSRVLKTREVRERYIRQPPVERILRNSGNSQRSRNVVAESVQVLRARTAAIKICANNIGELSNAACV